MSTFVTRIRALFGSRGNGKTPHTDIRSAELRAYEEHHRTLLVGRGIICWWSGMPPSEDGSRKPNGRALRD